MVRNTNGRTFYHHTPWASCRTGEPFFNQPWADDDHPWRSPAPPVDAGGVAKKITHFLEQ